MEITKHFLGRMRRPRLDENAGPIHDFVSRWSAIVSPIGLSVIPLYLGMQTYRLC